MKKRFAFYGLGFLILISLAGCSSPPQEQIDSALAAVEAAINEGADRYAREDLEELQGELDEVIRAVEEEQDSTFSDYGDAEDRLAGITARAEELRASIPAREEDARQTSITAVDAAKAAVEEARDMLASAPRGKGSSSDINAMTEELDRLEKAIPEIQNRVDAGEYLEASEMAGRVTEDASSISRQIRRAME